jgi:hypothetical protein
MFKRKWIGDRFPASLFDQENHIVIQGGLRILDYAGWGQWEDEI